MAKKTVKRKRQTKAARSEQPSIHVKTTVKDSVFTHLFKIPKYALALYHALYHTDEPITEDQIEIITLENVLLNQLYNDLGLLVGDRLFIFIEAQSTWSVNILVRIFIYAAYTLQKYIIQTRQNVYSSTRLDIPKMDFFVLYTGERKDRPAELTFTKEFCDGKESPLEIRVKMLYDGEEGDIINQYVVFTQVYMEQYRLYGRSQKTVLETIRICQEKNALKEYLEECKKEVIDMMMSLFDQQTVLDAYATECRQEGQQKAKRETAQTLFGMGLSPEKIAQAVKVDLDTVTQWLNGNAASLG